METLVPFCITAYNKNGNLESGDGFHRVYNSLNQLWKVYNGSDTGGPLLEVYTIIRSRSVS